MTGSNWLNWKTQAIVHAIGEAGRPLKSSEIEDRTGIYRTSVSKHINWNMKNKWVEVAVEEPQGNGHTIKYWWLTSMGAAKLEAVM